MMTPVQRQWVVGSAFACILLFGFVALVASRPKDRLSQVASDGGTGNAVRLLSDHRAALSFFDSPATLPDGKGLFATDFFKPAPAKAPPDKPPPPATREAAFMYRGFAELPGPVRIAYLEVDGRVRILAQGDAVLAGWSLSSFDQDTAVLAREGQTQNIPFNRPRTITVPAGAK